MIASTFKDSEGYNLKFDEKCPDSDKKYFMEQYPKVDSVVDKKLHCTTCNLHIGTAPISENKIRTHPVLNVTQCYKCYGFYNCGDFGTEEDGSENYCRWCGDGGKVFCCSSCKYVFCNKCIKSNLSRAYAEEIEVNDNWRCFVCDDEILKDHRASHWALKNFISKQSEKIQKSNATSRELVNLLEDDLSTCCSPTAQVPKAPAYQQPQTTTFAQQNGLILVSRATQPNTAFGAAKTEFEDNMISGMEIYQTAINKMITLSNSTSFKTLHNFSDIKELYNCLQYLFTVTSGNLKTIQKSLTTGLEGLAKFDVVEGDVVEGDVVEGDVVEEKTDVNN